MGVSIEGRIWLSRGSKGLTLNLNWIFSSVKKNSLQEGLISTLFLKASKNNPLRMSIAQESAMVPTNEPWAPINPPSKENHLFNWQHSRVKWNAQASRAHTFTVFKGVCRRILYVQVSQLVGWLESHSSFIHQRVAWLARPRRMLMILSGNELFLLAFWCFSRRRNKKKYWKTTWKKPDNYHDLDIIWMDDVWGYAIEFLLRIRFT